MFSENTWDPLVETLPYISPHLIDYYLKLFKQFKSKHQIKYLTLFFLNHENCRNWTKKRVYWGGMVYECSYFKILEYGDKYKTSFYTVLN